MTVSEEKGLRLIRIAGATVLSVYKGLLYFLSFLGPALIVHHFRSLPLPAVLALVITGYGFAGVVFLFLLVLTKKFLIGPVQTEGVETIRSKEGKKWFSAAFLSGTLTHSPFRHMATGLSLFATWYYRGMGAKMPDSVLLGGKTLISDPWSLELGENVNVGADAVILGHLGHGKEIFLGRVVIGDGAVVGMRAVIFPDVRIGNYAQVGAASLVVRGTRIPDGEIWAGIPAKKISARVKESSSANSLP